jgi:magnesium transporter
MTEDIDMGLKGDGTSLPDRSHIRIVENGNGSGNDLLKKRAVAVTLPPGSKPIKLQGDTAQEFLPRIQSSTLTWINFTVKDVEKDGPEVATAFGFSQSLIPTLLKGYYANFEDRDVELGILLPAVRLKKVDFQCYPLLILVKKNIVLTIHPEAVSRLLNFARYAEAFFRKLPDSMLPEDKVTMLLCRIIDENNNRNFEQLREIEEQADWLSESLLDLRRRGRSWAGASMR